MRTGIKTISSHPPKGRRSIQHWHITGIEIGTTLIVGITSSRNQVGTGMRLVLPQVVTK
jgi:hypothetical protein